MRFIAALVVTIAIAFGPAADASPRTDAEYIADSTISLSTEGLRDMLTQPFVTFFSQELSKHAAHIKDEERLAELIPDSILKPWFERTREIYIERLIEIEEADDLERYAVFLKSRDDNADHPPLDEELHGVATGAGFNVFASLFQVRPEIQGFLNTASPNDFPFLADILETEDIFVFRNRIMKRDLITKIRAGS